jgi:uncharacterized protein with PIN domain
MEVIEVELRFYEELNDFLPRERRKTSFLHRFRGTRSIKDLIESLGVPHTEIDVILVDGESVDFEYRVTGGERVAVYPTFERFDVSSLTRLRPEPLREPKFIVDVHLGKLARYLRLLGFDTVYERDLDDAAIASRSQAERRIVLTRDRGLLKRSAVTHGHAVRSMDPDTQLLEIVDAFDLRERIAPLSRCLKCNGRVREVERELVEHRLPKYTRLSYDRFHRCEDCGAVFWAGAHFERLRSLIESVDERALAERWSPEVESD